MSQTWLVPAGGDLWQVVSRASVERVNEDSLGGTAGKNSIDETLDTRAKKAVEHAVQEIRGAIEAAGRYPVSLTAGSVPPEAFQYALAVAAWRLCLPVPSLLSVLMADGGMFSPIGTLYKEACDWVKGVRSGARFTEPTDPAGADYQTAVSDSNPAVSGVRWGDNLADDSEYEAGLTADGVVISNLSQNMLTQ